MRQKLVKFHKHCVHVYCGDTAYIVSQINTRNIWHGAGIQIFSVTPKHLVYICHMYHISVPALRFSAFRALFDVSVPSCMRSQYTKTSAGFP